MKRALPILLAPMLLGSLQAETFYLRGGKKLVGKQLSDDGTNTVIEVNIDGVKERHTIKSRNIKKVTREDFEEKDFVAVEALANTPDLQTAEWYKEQLDKVIAPFKKEYPLSKRKFEIRRIEKSLKDEMAAIKAGGLKLDGKLISASERASAAYDIDAQILAGGFRQAVKNRKYNDAITLSDQLALDFPKSKVYGEVVAELPVMARKFRSTLESMIEYRIVEDQKLVKAKENSSPKRWKQLMAAIAVEEGRFAKKIAKEKADGVVWLSVNPRSLTDMRAQLVMVNAYLAKVEGIYNSHQAADAGAIFTKGWKLIEEKKFLEAREEIETFEALKANLSYFERLDEYYAEEKDLEKGRQRRKERNREPDLLDSYAEVDDYILETMVESLIYVKEAQDNKEESAKKCRRKLRVLTSRLARQYKRRAGLGALDPQDMEFQNTELARQIIELRPKYQVEHDKLLNTSEHLGLIKQPLLAFEAALPRADTYLSVQAKRKLQILEIEPEIQDEIEKLKAAAALKGEKIEEAALAKHREEIADRLLANPTARKKSKVAMELAGKAHIMRNGEYVETRIRNADYYIIYFTASW